MPTVLITGANRGIGLEFARQYAADGWTVIATAREPSPELDALGVRVELLDMREAEAVVRLGRGIGELDLLIANAGTFGVGGGVTFKVKAAGFTTRILLSTLFSGTLMAEATTEKGSRVPKTVPVGLTCQCNCVTSPGTSFPI